MTPVASPGGYVDAFLAEFNELAARDSMFFLHGFDVGKCASVKTILELPRPRLVEVVRCIVERQVASINGHSGSLELRSLLSAILRKKLPFTKDDLEMLVREVAKVGHSGWLEAVSPGTIVRLVEEQVESHGLTSSLRSALELLAARLRDLSSHYALAGQLLKRVEPLLKQADVGPTGLVPLRKPGVELTTGEPWVKMVQSRLGDLDEAARQHWNDLLTVCKQASSSKPSGKWLKQAQVQVAAIGGEFAEVVRAVFGEVGKPGPVEQGPDNALGFQADPTQVHSIHSDLLRGLVWSASLVDDAELTKALGDTADVCFKKLTGLGPRAPKIGNACLWALSNSTGTAAAAQLGRLKTRVKHASVKAQLAKAFDTAAEKAGISAAELEELAVPACGLTAIGECRKALGEHTALVNVVDGQAELVWLKPDGKEQASIPAAVKDAFADDVKALKNAVKEIDKQLPAQRVRLERLFLNERTWSLADFRARYLDHPLVGTLARRLIWRFTGPLSASDVCGLWHDGKFVGADGKVVEISDQARVSLWHPSLARPEEVKAWRDRLEALEIRQPFKQAHREIYLLTDAERQTGAYSNRFAAHVLKQHQFAALAFERGWQYRLQGEWDSANTPTLALPQLDLRVEFWVEPVQERERGTLLERSDISHNAIYIYVTTDQVRFYRGDSAVPLALVEVPPLAFSEVMRDVDLFVGVASVGNDPNWRDSGLFGMFGEYWEHYSFGELFPSAETRKAVLEKLVPRLKIADRCSFTDRFLVVRGEIRTYKIHLGSGNILMAPNDQYLCIVPDRKAQAPAKVYLPFEGDSMLSVILSKALLLAEDTKIKDPSIARQITPPAP